ncbi:MAG: hypothetical protein M1416_01665, partial [Candidatus Pacearchaeota archaeon]|nr:hypothetical protein [Candidatus Pacearchaeota archaeon]
RELFYIGADKIEWKNGTDMTVNGETINDAAVVIVASQVSGDISISEISINMTAEDDLYVPSGGKLSAATDLDEPQVLVSQNWDIQYAGLEAVDYEDISLKLSESAQQYTLRFTNYNGDEVVLPLLFTNSSGVYGGDKAADRLVLDPDGGSHGGNITKGDYFILSTANPTSSTTDAKSIVVKYDGADDTDSTDPKVYFTLNPGPNEQEETMSLSTTGTFTLKAAGGTFAFHNATTAITDDFAITVESGDFGGGAGQNNSMSTYIRTYYNTLINITDTNATNNEVEGHNDDLPNVITGSTWSVNVSVDDATRDGDDFTIPANGQVFNLLTISNGSTTSPDMVITFGGTGNWVSDPDNSDVTRYISRYGAEITRTDPTDDPADVEAKIPKSIVKPLLYVTTAEGVVVSSTTGGATSLGEVLVTDSEVSSVSSKNLIVVGGSCINSVAANLLGSTCGSDFTDKTGVGSGQFLIQSLTSSYSSSKIALVVAGYEAADTVNAATYLRTQTVDTTVGKKYKGTSATSAELVTTTA